MGEFDLFDAPVKTPAPADDFSAFDSAPVPAKAPPVDDRGFLSRSWDDIVGASGEAKRNLVEAGHNIKKAVAHPIERLKEIPGELATAYNDIDHAAGNALNSATMGAYKFARDEGPALARNIASGDPKKILFGNPEEPIGPGAIADAEWNAEHPLKSALGSAAGYATGLPKILGKAADTVVSPLASAFSKAVGSKIVTKLGAVPVAGPLLSAAAAGTGGAAKGIAGYELTAPALAAAEAPTGHRMEAAEAAATDPTGLLLSGAAGGIPDAASAGREALANAKDKIQAGAQKRVEAREFSDLGNKATRTQRDAIDALAPDVTAAVKEHDLGPIAEHPDKLAARSREALASEQARLSALHGEIGQADAGRFVANLEDAKKQFAASDPTARKIQAQIDAIREQNLPEPPKPQLSGKDLLAEIVDGAKSKQAERIGLKPEQTLKVAKEFGLEEVARDPHAFQAKAHAALGKVGHEIGEVYRAAPSGPDPAAYVADLEALAKKYQNNAQGAEAAAVRSHVADFRRAFENPDYRPPVPNPEFAQLRDEYKVPVAKIPANIPEFLGGDVPEWKPITAEQFRQYKTPLQKKGFATGILDPSTSASLGRKIAATATKALDSHLTDLAESHPDFATEHAKLADLNRQYGGLKNLVDIADRKVVAANLTPVEPASPFPRTGTIPVSDLIQIAENHEPFNFAKRQFAEPTTPGAKVNAAISEAAKKTLSEAAGDHAPALTALQKKVDALRLINEAAEYKARGLRYPTTGLRDVFDKSHRVMGSKIIGRAVTHAEDKILELARPIDRRLATMSPARRKATAGLVHAAGAGGDVQAAIQRAVAAGVPLAVAQRMADISRQTFAGQRKDQTTTAEASP